MNKGGLVITRFLKLQSLGDMFPERSFPPIINECPPGTNILKVVYQILLSRGHQLANLNTFENTQYHPLTTLSLINPT